MYVICGEALYDVYTRPAEGDALPLLARPGGSPFNVAIGLARLGTRAGLLAGLSRDPMGEHLRAILQREGVAPDYLVARDERTTLALVALDPEGVARYAFYGDGCADRSLVEADLPPLQPWVTGLHFGSYTLVAEPTASTLLALARRERGARLISLDPNVRPTVEPDMDRWRERVDAMAGLADVIKVSDEDLSLLHPDRTHEAIAAHWLAQGAGLVVVTLGSEGAVGFGPGGVSAQVPARLVRNADTVGAGDSFQAALLNRLPDRDTLRTIAASAAEIEALLRYAGTAAAITCSRPGADPPTRAELDAVLDAA